MYISMGLALVWSIIYIYLMSVFAETLAWCSLPSAHECSQVHERLRGPRAAPIVHCNVDS